mgnify:CR=1 FL=1
MPVAARNGKVYRASYDDATSIDVLGFATQDYELNVEKQVQKLGKLTGLPVFDKTFTPTIEGILYYPLQDNEFNLDNTYGLQISGGIQLYGNNLTGGKMLHNNTTLIETMSVYLSPSERDKVDIVNGFSLFFETFTADYFPRLIINTDTGIFHIGIFRNASNVIKFYHSMWNETPTELCTAELNTNYAVGFIVDIINRKFKVIIDSVLYTIDFPIGFSSPVAINNIYFELGRWAGISQFGIYNGTSVTELQSEMENLCLSVIPSKQIFLSKDGKVRYLDKTIPETYFRVPLGYIKDKTSIDVQLSEAVEMTYIASDYFEDSEEVGTLKTNTTGFIPDGWIRPDGRALSNTAFPTLYNLYSQQAFPWGSTATTFNVPTYSDPYLILKVRYSYKRAPETVPDYASKEYVDSAVGNVSSGSSADGNIGVNLTNRQFETDLSGYNLYKDTAQNTPVDGTGGVATALSVTRTNSNQLTGTYSLLLTKAASSALGEGLSADFSLDRGVRGLTQEISFLYETSTNYTDGEITIFLYDIVNNNYIPLSLSALPATYGYPSLFSTVFIPVFDSSNYRLVFHDTSSLLTSWTFKLDNIQIGNKNITQGAAISNPIEFPMVITGYATNPTKGTIVKDKAFWSRIGKRLEIDYCYEQSAAGTAGSGIYYYTLPYPVDLTLNPAGSVVGSCYISNNADEVSVSTAQGQVIVVNATQVILKLAPLSATGDALTYHSSSAYAFNNTILKIRLMMSVYCSQWTSNINLASDFTEYASNSGGEGIAAGTTYSNSSYCLNSSDGSYIPAVVSTNITGQTTDYIVKFSRPIMPTDSISIEILFNGDTIWRNCEDIYPRTAQNTARYGFHRSTTNSSPLGANYIFVSFGNAGAVSNGSTYGAVSTAPWSNYIAGGSMPTKWRVRKVSNGNMAEVPSVVRAEYMSVSSTAANTTINFQNKVEDTHNAVTTGSSWKFTAPITGVYLVQCNVYTTGSVCNVRLFKNGTGFRYIGSTPSTSTGGSQISTVRLLAGDYVYIQHDGANPQPADSNIYMQIARIGS